MPQTRLIYQLLQQYSMVLSVGPVRSSKTYSAVLAFFLWAIRNFENAAFGGATYSDPQFNAILLEAYRDTFGSRFPMVPKRYWWEFPTAIPGGRPNKLVKFLGSKDADSVRRAQGYTLQGLIIDEFVTFHSPEVINMLLTRLSEENAKAIMTCNPDGPLHWAKLDFVDNASRTDNLSATVVNFKIDDNYTINDDYKEFLENTFKPGTAQYRRLILGEWAALSGAIYTGLDTICKDPPVDVQPRWYDVAVDVASSSVTHALLIANYGHTSYVVDEWRHDGREYGKLTNLQQIEQIFEHFSQYPDFISENREWIVDYGGGGAAWKVELYNYLKEKNIPHDIPSLDKSDSEEGINVTQIWISTGKIKVASNVYHLLQELGNYTWDENAANKGQSKPKEGNDHGPHAIRYFCSHRHYIELNTYSDDLVLQRTLRGKAETDRRKRILYGSPKGPRGRSRNSRIALS